MAKQAPVGVTVEVEMVLSVSPATLERWREDPAEFWRYGLAVCFRNHARQITRAKFEALEMPATSEEGDVPTAA